MARLFQLVELTSGNVADDYDSLDEATVALTKAIQTHGADAMRTYSLLEFVDGAATLVAMEDELLEWVARSSSTSTGQTARDLIVSTATD